MFTQICATCHGLDGNGNGPAASSSTPSPATTPTRRGRRASPTTTSRRSSSAAAGGGQEPVDAAEPVAQGQPRGARRARARSSAASARSDRRVIVTSADGQWAAIRQGREVSVLAGGAGAPVGVLELESDDADLALVGPPNVLAVVTRDEAPRVTLHQLPYLDQVARLDLDGPMRLAAVTGPALALVCAMASRSRSCARRARAVVAEDRRRRRRRVRRRARAQPAPARPRCASSRCGTPSRAGRSCGCSSSCRRRRARVGAAQGHLWATRPGSDEVFVYRLSDGRPFRHLRRLRRSRRWSATRRRRCSCS